MNSQVRDSGSNADSLSVPSWYLPSRSVKYVNMKNDSQSGVSSLNAPRMRGDSSLPELRCSNSSAIFPSSCANAGINCISALAYSNTSSYVTLPINTVANGWQLIVTVQGNGNPIFSTTINGFGSASEGAICTL